VKKALNAENPNRSEDSLNEPDMANSDLTAAAYPAPCYRASRGSPYKRNC
jgi:hypothetical protein